MRTASAIIAFCVCLAAYPLVAQEVNEEHAQVIDLSNADVPIVSENLDLAEVATQIVEYTNSLRESEELAPLAVSPELTEAADYFARFMAEHDRYGHTADQQRPADRAAKHGYEYCIVSENIAYQYSTQGFSETELAQRFATAWENSPEHYKNMIDPDVSDTGVAVARSERTGYYYAVQMFGRPKSASIVFRIANRSGETVEYAVRSQRLPLPPRYTRIHEECRPGEVVFYLPGESEDQFRTEVVQPSRGDEFVLVREAGRVEVREKSAN